METPANTSDPTPLSPRSCQDKSGLLTATLFVGVLKGFQLLLLYVVFLGTNVRHDYAGPLFLGPDQSPRDRLAEIQARFSERLALIDGQFYLDIAKNGYCHGGDNSTLGARNAAFFPLLPLVFASLGQATADPLPWTLCLQVLLSMAATIGVWSLARELRIDPWLCVLLVVAFPTAIFQSFLYAESLFLALSVGAIVAARKDRRVIAGLLGYLGGLCRAQGILLAVLLAVEFLWRSDRSRRRDGTGAVLCGLAPVLGFATVALVNAAYCGSPWKFIEIQQGWGRSYSVGGLTEQLTGLGEYPGPMMDLVGLAFGVLLIPLAWRRLPWALAAYATVSLALPLLTGSILSLGRFVSVSFPHFLVLAAVLQRYPVLSAVTGTLFITLQILLARGALSWLIVS